MTVDRKGENRLYIEMGLENVVTHLGRIRVYVKFIAADPTPDLPQNVESEMLRLTACLDQWSEELVHCLVSHDLEAEKSPRGMIIVAVVAAFQKHFGDFLSPSQTKWSLDDDVELDDDYERSPMHICFEVRSDWEQIEHLEEHAIAYLAELFDGQAVLTLEETRYKQTTTLELSRGSSEAEMPIFGLHSPILLKIAMDNDASAELSFHPDAPAMRSILEAGPAAMRATPGGRRDLALLFLQGAIEEALLSCGNTETNCSLDDFTSANSNAIEITMPKSSHQGSVKLVKKALLKKWPGIFA